MQDKLFFNNSKGDRLCGILNNPSNNTSKPIIILVHGFSSHKNTKSFITINELLESQHISTFRIDLYAHGESEGLFETLTISEAVDDILNAIQFLKARGYSKIGLVGSSFGGTASIIAASKTNDLFVMALKSPVSSYGERAEKSLSKEDIQNWKNEGFRMIEDDGKKYKLNYSYFADFANNDGYKAAPNIQIPTIIIHGDKDAFVPVEQSIKIAKLLPRCELVVIKEGDHAYSKPGNLELMAKSISDFIINIIKISQ